MVYGYLPQLRSEMPNDVVSQVPSIIHNPEAMSLRVQCAVVWRTMEVGLHTLLAGLDAAAADALIAEGVVDPETPSYRHPVVVVDGTRRLWRGV